MYRCHNITKTEFNCNHEKYLKINRIKNTKNHILAGDFHIDIMHSNIKNNEASDNTNLQEFLNSLLENEYSPCSTGITRPGDNNSGSCIDNIFIKSNTFETTSYKLTNPITDHYTKILLMVYYAFYHSLINYGIIAWGAAGKTLLRLVQRIQDRINKLIHRNFLGNNNLLSINQVYAYTCLSYHYENLKEIFIKTARNSR